MPSEIKRGSPVIEKPSPRKKSTTSSATYIKTRPQAKPNRINPPRTERLYVRKRPHVRNQKSSISKILLKIAGRVALVLFSLILLAAAGLYGVCAVVFHGPSPSARDKLVTSTLEMSAAKFVPRLFFSKEEIDTIVQNNQVVDLEEVTNPSLIVIPPKKGEDEIEDNDEWKDYPDGIRLETIRGATYRGYIMIIRDPSRVYVATSSDFTGGAPGLRIAEAVKKEGAIAAINGGGFPDDGGVGAGNVPIGLTISKGKLLWGRLDLRYSGVVGFDKNNVLIVGDMSGQQALNMGIRDCVCFGPVLVVNGEPATVRGDSGSLNPRTAIGQRQDGAVIFLCVDGRMPNSLGASYSDLIDIMVEYGAVNAINLDGGSSTHMVYKGEHINVSSSLYGPRRMPTFFMAK
ncbi:MAG: phosphodiester glycosidase family protein [Clostridiales bacterium]|nr:phosphodiester glycosidase family protein [Clostridiales bacterium]